MQTIEENMISVKFIGEELEQMKKEMPAEMDIFNNTLMYYNKARSKDACLSVNGISDGVRYDYVMDSDAWHTFSEIEKMNKYTPVYDWAFMDKEDVDIYVNSDIADTMDEDEKILVLIFPPKTGEIPDESVWEDVINGKIGENVKAKLIYSISKKAKDYRGWNLDKKDTNILTRIKGSIDEKNYKHYYGMKDTLLESLPVQEYHYDEERGMLYEYRILNTYKYHTPIGEYEEDEARTKAEKEGLNFKAFSENLFIDGVEHDTKKIYCDEFVEITYGKLMEEE